MLRTMSSVCQKLSIWNNKQSWARAIDEMEILRTRIVYSTKSTFIQVVLKREDISWQTAKTTDDVLNSPIPIPEHSASSLMRFTIVSENSRGERSFVWSIHHALCDGWSMPRMQQRVEDFYFDDASLITATPYSHFIKYLSQTDTQASDRFLVIEIRLTTELALPKRCILGCRRTEQ